MPLKATCPSCGAPVVFQSTASLHAVCEFCRSTLVRHGTDLENLGRMADLLADASPLQLGTEGVYQGIHFALIGRIQLKYEAGLWNEWHLLFDDQKSGWLSDANGEYLISFLTPPQREIPAFESLQPDQRVQLAGREWQVTNTEQALCIAGEGELPFAFGAGYPAALVDLRTTDGQPGFASIDFSETPPLLFVGSAQPFDTFNFAKLRGNSAPAQSAGPVRALACPKCGSAITLHDPAIQSVACPACLTVLAPENDGLAILHKAAAERVKPKIPLGSRGRFEGHDWTVIGFQQREIAPANSYPPWQEYLLHHPQQGFRWLVEASGHWSWVRVLDTLPRYHEGQPSATLQGTEFTRYGTGEAITRFVIGEFNWRIRVGETWQTLDMVAPPQMLSREKNASEVSWSLGEYRTPEEIAAAFKLPQALPEAKGIGAIQPNPRIEPHRRTTRYFGLFLLLIVLAQVGWFIFGSRTLHEERLLFNPANDSTVTSKNFVLDRPARTLALTHETTLDNNWLGLNLALVEKRSGQAWQAASEISYWHGYDDGYWSEGSEKHELVFRDLPAGEYYLVIDPEFSENNPAPVGDRIAVVRDTTAWSNFLIALIALCAFWLISLYRKAAFETARWAEADFSSKGAVQSADDDTDSGSDD